jgi:hypothetical protein
MSKSREKAEVVNNGKMHEFSTAIKEFVNTNGTAWGQWLLGRNLYVVYSYGAHYPMYVYDQHIDRWYANTDYESNTTQRHKTQAKPRVTQPMTETDTYTLVRLIACGGTVNTVAERLEQAHVAQ